MGRRSDIAWRQLFVDAVVDNDGLTSIAVFESGEDNRPVVAKVIRTSGSVEAEMRAVLLAMQVAAKARWQTVEFVCDALGVVRMVQALAECRPEDLQPLRDRAWQFMDDHPGWTIEWVKRTHNSAAHAMAGQIMRAYKHGREDGRRDAFEERRSEWETVPA